MEKSAEVDRLLEAHQPLEKSDLEAREKVAAYEDFMKQHGSKIQYRKSVEKLEERRVLWSEGLRLVNEKLPAGTELFRSEANGRRMDGWAVFSSGSEAAHFLESLKKDVRVKGVFLDCFGTNCAEDAPLDKKEDGKKILHFHFTWKLRSDQDGQSPSSTSDGGGTIQDQKPGVDNDLE
ncbi:hypothetical protein SAMN06264849_11048 [Melghirimyces algeriensis]|uniref:Uncharacterized protein n=2 Tax=Melghirimyces algeriensis TaxID=910412 RepID=A0A521EPH5_9BACL|nr:hypothetical protein SAMN06264849_11048 [Melghirimyces algeriensis]